MLNEFFGFKRSPFSLLPEHRSIFLSETHAIARGVIQYGIENDTSFIVVTGPAGTGKTTLLANTIRDLESRYNVYKLDAVHKNFGSLLDHVIVALAIEGATEVPEIEKISIIRRHLRKTYSSEKKSILIVDEAHNLTHEMLEQLRLLVNINEEEECILTVILVGQGELLNKLNHSDLSQLAQRALVNYSMKHLNEDETRSYIDHKVKTVMLDPKRIFNNQANRMVFLASEGVPRKINKICDSSLVYAFAANQNIVDADIVNQVITDMVLTGAIDGRSVKNLKLSLSLDFRHMYSNNDEITADAVKSLFQ